MLYIEERPKKIFAKRHSQFPRELIKYVLYFDKDDFLDSRMTVAFLDGFPVQHVQVRSMSLVMVMVKRNNMQLEINPCYLVQAIHFSAWICPLPF